jgi:hypothetical protein
MRLDIRLPLGLLFAILGLVMGGYGLVEGAELPGGARSWNANAGWGGVLLVFGVGMLILARRALVRNRAGLR